MIHDLLLTHALGTWFLAGAAWTLQLVVIPALQVEPEAHWDRHAQLFRRLLRLVFWPMVILEGGSALLAALLKPPGIPTWLHAVNLALLICIWGSIPLSAVLVGHPPLARYDPTGFARFARLHWLRVVVWTLRAGVVVVMLRLAALAARGG